MSRSLQTSILRSDLKSTVVAVAIILTGGNASAADHGAGKNLHDENCSHCHSDAVYQRDNKLVKNYPGLVKRVNRCQLSLELQWFEEEINQVSRYLNSRYYRFPQK